MPLVNVSKIYTIDRFIAEQGSKYPQATGEFTSLLHHLMFAIRIIARDVRRAGLNDILGLTEHYNVHGENVKRIDLFANEVIFRAMDHTGHLCAMLSEESVNIIKIPNQFKKGKYLLAFDPLDGSGNMDVNATIGTIFALYQRLDPKSELDGTEEDFLQPGSAMKAAGYVLYGSSTILAYTTGNGVNVFTFDPTIGEFLLTYENLTIPKRGKHYSGNEGNSKKWPLEVQQYIDYIKTPSEDKTRPYSLRYIGTAAADVHRMLHFGGIYLYPSEKSQPNGKLRLLYEVNPLSWIIEQAGGKAITGTQRVLDIQPQNLHQRVPWYSGSIENIAELELFLKGEHPFQKS